MDSSNTQSKQETNRKAVASMVMGILSLIIPYVGLILGILAIVYARKASKEIENTGQAGKGFATAGLVTGIIGTALYAIFIIVAVIAFMGAAAYDAY